MAEAGRVELPLESPHYHDRGAPVAPPEDSERGVTVIDM